MSIANIEDRKIHKTISNITNPFIEADSSLEMILVLFICVMSLESGGLCALSRPFEKVTYLYIFKNGAKI